MTTDPREAVVDQARALSAALVLLRETEQIIRSLDLPYGAERDLEREVLTRQEAVWEAEDALEEAVRRLNCAEESHA